MRLIDANALMEAFRTYMVENHDREKCVSEENCNACERGCLWRKIVVKAPTIDLESLRPQGEWVVTYYTTTSKRGRVIANAKYVCPECKHSNGRKRSNYCPNCGASMKGGTA